jgi:hypothetical protein
MLKHVNRKAIGKKSLVHNKALLSGNRFEMQTPFFARTLGKTEGDRFGDS